ncbi:hypothetical protein [Marinimicrococcus flavescens]|uniref:Anti-sigma factor NepR domain-containing protein n=1 Tax=Marinimicrococcus flavescens TaxID=3031815 RepID=A0AAP3XRE8_9PROT|nr:hypothetical protein [Marinimicrococcus flavescens]
MQSKREATNTQETRRDRHRATPLDDAFERWLAARMRKVYGDPRERELPRDMLELVQRFAQGG